MGNGFQTVYYFCKELHLRSYRVPHTGFRSFSQKFQVLQIFRFSSFKFIMSLINLGFFGIRKSTVGEVALLGVISKF